MSNCFAYYMPENLSEVNGLISTMQDKNYLFYGGGSEIISMTRVKNINPDAVIDIKSISECRELEVRDSKINIGAAVTLYEIKESNIFPLLGTTISRIADHTNQCRITLGGNICGSIIYKESILPLLLADAQVNIFSNGNIVTKNIKEVFDKKLLLAKGEFITSVSINERYRELPYVHVKRVKNSKTDYPLLTVAAINDNGRIKIAFSGLFNYPIRDESIENIINDKNKGIEERANEVVSNLPDIPLNDLIASSQWREFILKRMLIEILGRLQ